MNTDKAIKKLELKIKSLRAKSHKMEAHRKKTALRRALAVVKKFGFDSLHELLEIADTAAVATSSKRKRAKIDDTMRKSVVAMLKTGETVAETAKRHKISAPSVNLIKTRAGLTKSRKKVVKAAQEKPAPRVIKRPKVVPAAAAPPQPKAE
jgi:hypothetical protein